MTDRHGDASQSRRDPELTELLDFFEYRHLAEFLQPIAGPFGALARDLTARLEGRTRHPGQLAAAVGKLLEARDCAMRAALVCNDGPGWHVLAPDAEKRADEGLAAQGQDRELPRGPSS